jgi:toxoflavin synthase
MSHFNDISGDYSAFIAHDPVRAVHYAAVEQQLDSVLGTRIGDSGCGEGLFSRRLARQGARVTAWDAASNLISKAQTLESQNPLDISYAVADAQDFVTDTPQNNIVSVMVLPYMRDAETLHAVMRSTYQSLNTRGKLLAVVLNPDLQIDGEGRFANRRFESRGNSVVRVHFLDPVTKAEQTYAEPNQFSRQTYEQAAHSAGFKAVEWQAITVHDEVLQALGPEFWGDFNAIQPYSLYVAHRQ